MPHKDAAYKLKPKDILLSPTFSDNTKLLDSGLLRYPSRSQIMRCEPCLTSLNLRMSGRLPFALIEASSNL